MKILNILAKLPNQIRERIHRPVKLRINNDTPGFFIPNEYEETLRTMVHTEEHTNGRTAHIDDLRRMLEE